MLRFSPGEYYTTNLYLAAYICLTLLNFMFYTNEAKNQYDYDRGSVVFDEPDHGFHFDFKVSTYREVYYIDVMRNIIRTQNDESMITFEDFVDMSAWLSLRTSEEAFQVNALFGHYRQVYSSNVHQDTSGEARARQRILDMMNELSIDSLNIDTLIQQNLR